MIHVDWMIGSGSMDIDGLDEKGNITPVFRRGEWAQFQFKLGEISYIRSHYEKSELDFIFDQ